ncbi:MAG: hypothetical protein JXJ17_06270 [Anaerolineae bacterium]|nr:hypothetical protein [Anaerolineae bacterium]
MWKDLRLAVLIAICLIVLGEGAAWLADSQRDRPPPGLGTNHPTVEERWRDLRKAARRSESIDCVFFGNSMVGSAIDAGIIEQAIGNELGQAVNCYDLSASGMTASDVGIFGEIVVEFYKPSLIVYGISARDFSEAFGQDVDEAMLESEWIRYRQGEPSPGGWLGHHSEAYGQVLGLTSWLKYFSTNWTHRDPELLDLQDDRTVEERLGVVNIIPGDQLAALKTPEVSASDIAGLDQLMALRDQSVTVILVEMPVYEGVWEPVFGGYENYADRFLAPMDAYAEENDVVFIHSTPFTLVDAEDWIDWEHMEKSGQRVFSEWLGEQIVDGITEGKIEIPTD